MDGQSYETLRWHSRGRIVSREEGIRADYLMLTKSVKGRSPTKKENDQPRTTIRDPRSTPGARKRVQRLTGSSKELGIKTTRHEKPPASGRVVCDERRLQDQDKPKRGGGRWSFGQVKQVFLYRERGLCGGHDAALASFESKQEDHTLGSRRFPTS